VGGVPGEHLAQLPLTEEQHPVGDLGPDGQHEAFGETVRPRTPRRNPERLDTGIDQYRVERRRDLTGPIANEEPEPADVFAEIYQQVAACWVVQGPSGCPVTPRMCR
jgi:hypothetical protein